MLVIGLGGLKKKRRRDATNGLKCGVISSSSWSKEDGVKTITPIPSQLIPLLRGQLCFLSLLPFGKYTSGERNKECPYKTCATMWHSNYEDILNYIIMKHVSA